MKELITIQKELKAPKGNYNSFGKYKYRSCEDILEAVKPLLHREGCTLTLSDEPMLVGDRYYIKATATIHKDAEHISVTGYAREEKDKKGMDESQITGTASSYARKYALNGLFLIDDTKDADTDEYHKTTTAKQETASEPMATQEEKKTFLAICNDLQIDYNLVLKQVGVTGQMTAEQYEKCLVVLSEVSESRQ